MDSSSPMVLVAETSTNKRTSSTAQGKSWKPCFNFAKGSCLIGDSCRYVHDANARINNTNSRGCGASDSNTHELLTKLITQLGNLGMHNGSIVTMPNTVTTPSNVNMPDTNTMATIVPMTFHTGLSLPPKLLQPTMHLLLGQTVSAPYATQPNAPVVTNSGQATLLPQAFTTGTLHDPTTGAWNMDTGASSHLNNSVTSLSTILNSCMYSTVSVGDGHSIPVTKYLKLNNVLITPHIVKNFIYVLQFVRDNDCTIEFNSFGFSVKDFMTHRVLLRCDSTGDLYPITTPSPIPSAFLVSQQTWHQQLGHPGSDVLRRLVSNNVVSCNKEKPPVLCHACRLVKHVRLPFINSSTIVSSCFDIVHSDVWNSPIPSLSGF
ncbi:ribonuclease H-like domain-containing protein [Tanacetum coccineum]